MKLCDLHFAAAEYAALVIFKILLSINVINFRLHNKSNSRSCVFKVLCMQVCKTMH